MKEKMSDVSSPGSHRSRSSKSDLPTETQSSDRETAESSRPTSMVELIKITSKTKYVAQLYFGQNKFPSDKEFERVMEAAERAIENHVYPERISQGSSGSYFIKNEDSEMIGVFKPKNEEPYGQLNPKWTKWMHRLCCPCCFGRSCLMPNQGYLSEAAASLVDDKLGLGVVPKTRIVYLAAPTFNYGELDRSKADTKRRIMDRYPTIGRKFTRIGLPPKIGSFQCFVRGYKDADEVLRNFETKPMSAEMEKDFQLQFERLVVLDYVIRNTDRGNNNWLIKLRESDVEADPNEPSIKIAAIDNGLAFPFKHPDSVRMYPYGWYRLPQARIPFSKKTCELVLPKLDDMNFVDGLAVELRNLLMIDKSYSKSVADRQLGVMRGQIVNLAQALREQYSPARLAEMCPMTVMQKRGGGHQSFRSRNPIFSRW